MSVCCLCSRKGRITYPNPIPTPNQATALVPTPAECGRSDAPDWWPSLPPLRGAAEDDAIEGGQGGQGGQGEVLSSSLLSIT